MPIAAFSHACAKSRHHRHSSDLSLPPGSARALAVHPGGEVLASVCLDRYLRLHSCATRQLLAKVYCKTLPTGELHCAGWGGVCGLLAKLHCKTLDTGG